LNNWALSLADHGEFSKALDYLDYAEHITPAHGVVQANAAMIRRKYSDQHSTSFRAVSPLTVIDVK